jgi:hypothetical protein
MTNQPTDAPIVAHNRHDLRTTNTILALNVMLDAITARHDMNSISASTSDISPKRLKITRLGQPPVRARLRLAANLARLARRPRQTTPMRMLALVAGLPFTPWVVAGN